MNTSQNKGDHEQDYIRRVGADERRQQRPRQRKAWFWLGMMGLVGWSVAVPTVLGVAFGVWLDKSYPGQPSWTLTLLGLGLAAGVLSAWYWVRKEGGDE